ncbi:C10 family peptidase [Porphyromonas gulae]|uniref:C10 family peptidase n=1 Tax=Porphyromonas gulae TaxID=111105 RepID=UPI0026E92961|nr:C10 family peptidase [Porphyromonas gulae]
MMKRFFLALGLLLLCVPMLQAGPVTRSKAEQTAKNFFAKRQHSTTSAAPSIRMNFVYRAAERGEALFFVFNRGEKDGFVLVSADDRFPEVIGYAFKGHFDAKHMPDNLRGWLKGYEQEMLAVIEGKAEPIDPAREAEPTRDLPSSIAPILETGEHESDPILWDQGYPFNTLHPLLPSGQNAYTGCVATAMGQIMRHYKWPEKASGGYNYYDDMTGTHTHYSGTFGETYDWSKMPGNIGVDISSEEVKALSKFMLDVSFSVNMQFAEFGSGTFSIFVERALRETFHYKKSLRYIHRSLLPAKEWKDMIRKELVANRPVYYAGADGSMGHAFVCDGYEPDGTFHFNWGWGGMSNGNFYLNLLNPGSLGTGAGNGGYSTDQEVVIGIEPASNEDPGIAPDPTITLYDLQHNMSEEALELRVKIKNASTYAGDVELAYRLTLPDGTETINSAVTVPIIWEDIIGESTGNITIPRGRFAEGKNIVSILYRTDGMAEWKELKHILMGLVNRIEVTMPAGEVAYSAADARVAIKESSLSHNLKAYSDCKLTATLYNPGTEEFRSRATFALRNEEGRLYLLGKRLIELAPGDEAGEKITIKVKALKARAGQYKLICTGDMESFPEDASWIELASVQVVQTASAHQSLLVASNPQVDLLTVYRKNPQSLPAFSIVNEGGVSFSGKLEIALVNPYREEFFSAKKVSATIHTGESKVVEPELTGSSPFYTNPDRYPDGIYYVVVRELEFGETIDLLGDNYYRIRLVTGQSNSDIVGQNAPAIELYPNPARDYVQVSVPSSYVGGTLRLLDIQGRMHLSTKIDSEDMRLDIGHLPSGRYIIVAEDLVGKLHIR